jgi:hypothetical protein
MPVVPRLKLKQPEDMRTPAPVPERFLPDVGGVSPVVRR